MSNKFVAPIRGVRQKEPAGDPHEPTAPIKFDAVTAHDIGASVPPEREFPPGPHALLNEWRSRAAFFQDHNLNDIASLIQKLAQELEDALDAEADQVFTLTEAAEVSAVSREHLGRLIREGRIPNAGRKGAPRILGQHIPRNVGVALPAPSASDHLPDATAIVRSIEDNLRSEGDIRRSGTWPCPCTLDRSL